MGLLRAVAALCPCGTDAATATTGVRTRRHPQVAAIHLTPDLFSVENGMMTPTFKLKRPQAAQAFQDVITAMYADLKKQGS